MKHICVVTPTTGSPELLDAIRTVQQQTISVEHLIVCDGEKFKSRLNETLKTLPSGSSATDSEPVP